MAGRATGPADILGFEFRGAPFTRFARDSLGRFTRLWPAVEAASLLNAQFVQKLIVEYFVDSLDVVGRPQRESAYLRHALESSQFIRANLDGFVVNPKGYLDSSKAAPYWRNLEKGTTRFVGRKIQGFFQSREGKAYGPMGSRYPRDVRMFQTAAVYENHVPAGKHAKAGFGETKTMMQIGGGRSRVNGGRAFRVTQNRQRNRPKPHWDIRIKRPIRAHNYLTKAIEEAFGSGTFEHNYTEALRAAGLKATVKKIR